MNADRQSIYLHIYLFLPHLLPDFCSWIFLQEPNKCLGTLFSLQTEETFPPPEQEFLFFSVKAACLHLEAGIVLVCASVKTGMAAGWMPFSPPPTEKMSGIIFPPLHPADTRDRWSEDKTAAPRRLKPWQQGARCNRKAARPIREENPLPSKCVPEVK